MGLLGRSSTQDGKRNGTTIVAAGTHLVGDLTLNDGFHLDGRMEGSIRSEANVSIGERGRFEGDIVAARVLVSGHFQGRIEADRLEIVASGEVTGEIQVTELVIEAGGSFNGSSRIRSPDTQRQLGYQGDGKEAPPRAQSAKDETEPGLKILPARPQAL